jgi:hypothetical protein
VVLLVFLVVVGTESGPDKFVFVFEVTRIVVELFDTEVDEEDEEELDEEEDDDEEEDFVGKVNGPNAPPAVRTVPTLFCEVVAADAIDGVLSKEATTIVT